jgi:LysM repeat protein
MTKRKKKFDFKRLKGLLPYIVTSVLTLTIVFVGSLDKNNSDTSLSLNTFAEDNYKVSVDQLSAMYVVADVSDTFNLASATDVASNYVVTTSMYTAGQTSTGKIEKPNITDIAVSRGVIEYVVKEGDDLASIASYYKVSTDQIRWSNGKKNTNISAGEVLYIPSTSGIVYTVKSGDTVEEIASKYGSSVAEIIALNDLEVSGISTGMRILIKGGTLPETERPEYVPPVRATYYYTYLGSNSARQNIEVLGTFYGLGGPYVAGQCTQWAWYNRQDLPSNLGNANTWAVRAANAGYTVKHGAPVAGAVFQSSAGWYGHVGYVEAVNADGSIVATEMNYNYRAFVAIRSTIPASSAANLNYIYPPGM